MPYDSHMHIRNCEDCDVVDIVLRNELLETDDILRVIENYLNLDVDKLRAMDTDDINTLKEIKKLMNSIDFNKLEKDIVSAKVIYKL